VKALRFLVTLSVLLVRLGAVSGQEIHVDQRTRLLLDGAIGTQSALGYKFPSTAFGPALEVPIGRRWEFQARASYSPDRKVVTGDGHSLNLSASAIRFVTQRWGVLARVEPTWLWTSQFQKRSWFPTAGIVIRNDYFGSGRFYLTYVFPTGCVWATSSDPCRIQSNRLQGLKVLQDVRSSQHLRWGFESGLYHACDQSNPYEPKIARKCYWAATALATVRFEFHLGSRPHAVPGVVNSDNF
jgi:hypothetical protein